MNNEKIKDIPEITRDKDGKVIKYTPQKRSNIKPYTPASFMKSDEAPKKLKPLSKKTDNYLQKVIKIAQQEKRRMVFTRPQDLSSMKNNGWYTPKRNGKLLVDKSKNVIVMLSMNGHRSIIERFTGVLKKRV